MNGLSLGLNKTVSNSYLLAECRHFETLRLRVGLNKTVSNDQQLPPIYSICIIFYTELTVYYTIG